MAGIYKVKKIKWLGGDVSRLQRDTTNLAV